MSKLNPFVVNQFDCGCRIISEFPGGTGVKTVHRCSLHAAAPQLLEALKGIQEASLDGRACPEWLAERLISVDCRNCQSGGPVMSFLFDAQVAAAAPRLLDALRRVLTAGNKPLLSAKENRDAFDAAIRDGWAAIAEAEGRRMPQRANEQLSQPVETDEGSANDKEVNKELSIDLLIKAVRLIRQFHAIPLADREEKGAWKRYYANATEMKPLREALAKAGITEVKL